MNHCRTTWLSVLPFCTPTFSFLVQIQFNRFFQSHLFPKHRQSLKATGERTLSSSRANNGGRFRVNWLLILMKYVLFYHMSPCCLCLKLLQAEELAYIYQNIGFQYSFETRFEDAGFCLFQGRFDPRILISYFSDLRGTLLDADPMHDTFLSVAGCMPPYNSIDDITRLLPVPCPRSPASARPQCSRGQLSP